jgi:hypothetical protein
MSKQINIRMAVNFANTRRGKAEVDFFQYDGDNDLQQISDFDLRQLILTNGKNINLEVSFGDGHETRDAISLIDVLGETRQTLYARREQCDDGKVVDYNDLRVVLYKDQNATEEFAVFDSYSYNSKPRHGDSIASVSDKAYYLIWLADKLKEENGKEQCVKSV